MEPKSSNRVRGMLAAMMFLEYAVWGSWTPILGETISQRLNATGAEIGAVYGVLWLACILIALGGLETKPRQQDRAFRGIKLCERLRFTCQLKQPTACVPTRQHEVNGLHALGALDIQVLKNPARRCSLRFQTLG